MSNTFETANYICCDCERLKKVLEFYADENNYEETAIDYTTFDSRPIEGYKIVQEGGEMARQILKETNNSRTERM